MLPIIFTKTNFNTIFIATNNESECDTVQVAGPRKRFPKIAWHNSQWQPARAYEYIT